MNRPLPSTERGVALLLVLSVLTLISVPLLLYAGTAMRLRVERRLHEESRLAHALLPECEKAIVRWLNREADQVVLAPDAEEPYLRVLWDGWRVENGSVEIEIGAWDQCGMVPIEAARSNGQLLHGIPVSVEPRIRELLAAHDARQPFGLDLLASRSPYFDPFPSLPVQESVRKRSGLAGQRSAAAIAMDAEFAWFEAEAATPSRHRATSASVESATASPALGAFLATHSGARIHVHTAPARLLEVVFRDLGRGGLESVLERRAKGERVPIESIPSTEFPSTDSAVVPWVLADTSTAWSFRVEITQARGRRAFWCVFVKRRSGWDCVQRCCIS